MKYRASLARRGDWKASFLTIPMVLLALLRVTPTIAEPVPLPPPRPQEMPLPAEAAKPAMPGSAPVSAPISQTGSEMCFNRLRELGFAFEPAEQPQAGNTQCVIDIPVRLLSVPVSSHPQQTIVLKEKPVLACVFAENFGHWISDLAAPVITGRTGSNLTAVRTGPGFECRNRNGSPTGKLSAHARGRAIDVSHFELSDGGSIFVKPDGNASHADTIAALRKAACGWFTTILGPGSDPSHTDHLHLDVEPHGSSDRYRICQ